MKLPEVSKRTMMIGGAGVLAVVAFCYVNRSKAAGVIRAWNDPQQPPEGVAAQGTLNGVPMPSYDLNAATGERTKGYRIRRLYAPTLEADPQSIVLGLKPENRVDVY